MEIRHIKLAQLIIELIFFSDTSRIRSLYTRKIFKTRVEKFYFFSIGFLY
jgi:hypothetical protein